MIKNLRVTVDGTTYDVTVELPDDAQSLAGSAAPSVAPTPPASASRLAKPADPQPLAPSASTTGNAGVAAAPGDVPSPLAGRVTAIVVTSGQTIKEGDHLLTLEAMKMNTFVFAPKSGAIGEIKVAIGDAVEEGQPLVKIQ